MDDNKKKLYDALSQDYDLGSYEQFSSDIQDENKRRKLYDATVEEYDYGDFDSFSQQLGFGTQEESRPVESDNSAPSIDEVQGRKTFNISRNPAIEEEYRATMQPAPKPAQQEPVQQAPAKDFGVQNYYQEAKQAAEEQPKPSVQTEKTTDERNLDAINESFAEQDFPSIKDQNGNEYKMKAAAGIDADGTLHIVATDKDGKDVELTAGNYADFMPDNSIEGKNRRQMAEDRARIDDIDKQIQDLKDKDFHGSREERRRLESEKQRALYRLDNNPEYQKMIQQGRDTIAQRTAELDEALRQSGGDTGGRTIEEIAGDFNPVQAEGDAMKMRNEQVYSAAARMLQDADNIMATGLRYIEDRSGQKGEFLKAAGKTMSDPDFWTMGLTDIVDNVTFRDVMERAVAQAEAEAKGEQYDKPLSPIEEKLVEAYLTRAQAMMLRSDDQSRGSKMGQGAAQSLQFMIDMAISGGLGKAVTKGAAEAFTKKAVNKFGRKLSEMGTETAFKTGIKAATKEAGGLGIKLAGDIIETVPKVALSPLTAQSISEQAATYDPEKGFKSWGESLGRGLASAAVEKFSELHGGIYERAAKNIFNVSGANALYRKLVSEDLRNTFRNIQKSTAVGKATEFFAKGGWDGMWEMAEEMENAAFYQLMGEQGAWEDFWRRENWLEMAGSFAPMTLFGMGMNAGQRIFAERKYEKSLAKLGEMGFNVDQLRDIGRTSTISDLSAYLSEGAEAVQNRKLAGTVEGVWDVAGDRRETAQALVDYVKSAARLQALDGLYQGEQDQRIEDKRSEISESVGGKQFWKEDDSVELVDLGDGETAYVVSAPDADGRVAILHADGTPGYTTIGGVAEDENGNRGTTVMPMDEYLAMRVMADRQNDEAARMQTEREVMVGGVQQQYELGAPIAVPQGEKAVNGTVIGVSDDGLSVQFEDGTIGDFDWDTVSAWYGQSVSPMSDQEQEEAAAAALDAQDDARSEMAQSIEAGLEPGATVQGDDGKTYTVLGFQKDSIDLENGTARFTLQDGADIMDMTLPFADFVANGLRKGEEAARAEEARLAEEQRAAEEEKKRLEAEAAAKAEEEAKRRKEPGYMDELFETNPQEFAQLNDEQNQDGGADTREIFNTKIAELTAQVEELGKRRSASTVPSERRSLDYEAKKLRDRIGSMRAVLDSYNTEEETPAQPAPAEAPQGPSGAVVMTPQERKDAAKKAAQEQMGAEVAARVERFMNSRKVLGNPTMRRFGGKMRKAHYVLVEADAPIPSHDALNGFAPIAENSRSYGETQQKEVMRNAQRFNSDALHMTPTLRQDGLVPEGNGRTMMSQLAAANHDKGWDKDYLEVLSYEAGNYGFSQEDLDSFEHPRVYIMFDEGEEIELTTRNMNESNLDEKKGESKAQVAARMSKLLKESPRALENIMDDVYGVMEYDPTRSAIPQIKDVAGKPSLVANILKNLVAAGAITESNIANYLNERDKTGNNAFVELLENITLGLTFDEESLKILLDYAYSNSEAIKRSVARASALMQRLSGYYGEEYDMSRKFNDAIELLYRAAKFQEASKLPATADAVAEYLNDNTAIFDEGLTFEDDVVALARLIWNYKKETNGRSLYETLGSLIDRIGRIVSSKEAGDGGMFADLEEVKYESLSDLIKNTIFEKTGIKPLDNDQGRENSAPDGATQQGTRVETETQSEAVENDSVVNSEYAGKENDGRAGTYSGTRGSTEGYESRSSSTGTETVGQTDQSGYSVLDDEIARLEKEIADKIRGQLNAGLDPSLLPLVGRLAIAYIERGAYKIADFAAKMVAKFGDAIRTYIAPAYAYARQAFRIEGKRDVVDQMDNADTIDNFDHENFDKAPTAPAESKPAPTVDSIFAETTGQQEAETVAEQIEEARQEVDTNPTDAQKEAGNYRKGHVTIDGYDISIENPKGSIRRGTDANGNEWQVEMNNDYGYIRMTEGPDGDHIDVFLSDTPTQGNVFVVDQVNPDTRAFDEHKVMYGFPDEQSAREAYLSNYSPGWKGLGNITEVSKDEFKKWIESSHRKTKPFAEYKSVTPVEEQPSEDFGGLFAQPTDNQQNNSENSRISQNDSVTSQKEAQTAFRDTVRDALLKAVETGEKPYAGIVQLRQAAREAGMEIDERGATDTLIQEIVEDALVRAAREVNGAAVIEGKTLKERYDLIVKLYKMQPSINQRSSERIAKQQYSTPLPMAFMADTFAWSLGTTVLEPTAGTGMMVFAVSPRSIHANEIDPTRLEVLRGMNYAEVTDQDATEQFPADRKYGAIIANPPFGSSGQSVEIDGVTFTKLEHIIALNALDAMRDNGKAAIIVGGNMEYHPNGAVKTDAKFWHFLYDHYNVKGVVDMDGSLYSRQGTTYPTRMILIDGKRSAEERQRSTVYAPVKDKAPKKAETFTALFNIVQEITNSDTKTNGYEVLRTEGEILLPDNSNASGSIDTGGRSGESGSDGSIVRTGGGERGVERGRGGSTRNEGSNEQQRTLGTDELAGELPVRSGDGTTVAEARPEPVLGEDEARGQGDTAGPDRGGILGGRGGVAEQGGRGSAPVGDAGGSVSSEVLGESGLGEVRRVEEKRDLKSDKLHYIQHSRSQGLDSMSPAPMAEAMDSALSRIEEEYGPIDDFVRKELGYKTNDELYNALKAEQVDSVAMAIYQMKNGQAMIIGDQTGVGKGRQMAALIRWAVRQGKKPIFVTQKAGLFSDMYRDLADIGSADLVPFIFNSDGDMTYEDENGNLVIAYKHASDSLLKQAFDKGELPEGCDYAVLSYTQVSSGDAVSRAKSKKEGSRSSKSKVHKSTPKADLLRKIVAGNYLLMDESHTAAGESNTGAYFRSLLESAAGATFASATFAKRPDTMPLYALRTAMSKANIEVKELIGAIKKGGVALQEIMSRALTQTGQMVRRERDMSDVVTDWITVDDPETVARVRENYDKTITAFNAIIDFQNQFVRPAITEIASDVAQTGGYATQRQGSKDLGIDNALFASKTYNYTKQLMLALKADAIVDKVIEEIKAGRHPVIALESTMESGLSEDGYKVGDIVSDSSYAPSLIRGLQGIMRYDIKSGGDVIRAGVLSPSDLGPAGERRYHELVEMIRQSTEGIFLSPLDLIAMKLKAAGYKVGELTGRELIVQEGADGGFVVAKRDNSGKAKKKAAADFNSGKLDVLILNKAAATGISLHASERFKDQRQRTMIMAQPMSDINDYMQMIGRIDRTGQVHRGYYINLALPVPAEQRFNMMLSTKLKSLNANTAADQEGGGSVEAVDLLNKYGDQVVVEYLRDHTDVYEKLGDKALINKKEAVSAAQLDDYKPQEDDARRITGRVALLSTQEQEEFYDDVIQRYNDLIQYLNDTGTNDLKITTLPLRAETKSKKVSSKGVNPDGNNPFAKDAYVETVEMDNLRKPMKADEVEATIEKLNGSRDGGPARVRKLTALVTEDQSRKVDAENERYEKARVKLSEDIAKFTDKVNAREKQDEEGKQKDIREYTEDQTQKVEQKHQENLDRIGGQAATFRRRLAMFQVGATYLVPDQLDNQMFVNSSPAIFCGYKANDAKLTPSTTFAVFAVLDGRRKIEVKLSQPGPLETIKNHTSDNWGRAHEVDLSNWDSRAVSTARKSGFIMTGNILQALVDAMDEYGNFPGQLVSYTDMDGNVHDGVLMPDNWNPSQLRSSGVPINSKLDALLAGDDLESTDGKVKVSRIRYGGRFVYEISVPKSKKEGGKFFLDDALLKAADNSFYTSRGHMVMDVWGENRIKACLDILSGLGVRVADETEEQEDARAERYRIREDEPPVRIGTGYKVFVWKDGKLYPPMVANPNGASTPVGLWLDADAAPIAGTTKTGRPQVKAGGKGTQGGSGTLAYRPGWHLGVIPYAKQFNRKGESGERELFPKNFVWAEVDYAADVDYQDEAMSYGMNANGNFQHSLAGLPYLPKDGAYMYRTNPDPTTDPWIITGAMRVRRLVPPSEVDAMVEASGRAPQKREEGAVTDEQINALNAEIEQQMQMDAEQTTRFLEDMAENLGEKVTVITDVNEIKDKNGAKQRRKRRSKGWFDPNTGRIYIVLPNNQSVADAEATLLHEAIGHKAVQELIGEERFNAFIDDIYENADPGMKERIDALRKERNLADNREATEEYIAEMAERGVEDDLEMSFWDRVKAAFRDLMRAIGVKLRFTDEDIRYILWKAKRGAEKKGESIMEAAERIGRDVEMRRIAEASYSPVSAEEENPEPEPSGPEGNGPKRPGREVRYRPAENLSRSSRVLRDRAITNDTQDVALRMYGNEVMLGTNVVRELLVDQHTAVRTAMRAIEKESGKEVTAKEDINEALNQLSSKQKAAADRYSKGFLKPLEETVAKVAKEMDVEFEDIIQYVSLRRALECNVLYAKRDAKEYYQKKHDDAVTNTEARTDIDRAAKDAIIRRLDAELQNELNDTDREMSDKYRELRGTDGKHVGKDYGATISWFSEYVDANGNRTDVIPDRERHESVQTYQRRLKGMRKPVAGAETLAGAERLANEYIQDFEGRSGELTRELWDKINAATQEILRIEYENHLITKEMYDDIRSRSQYYVPLRGFADMTAEDAFSYTTDDLSNTFVPALMRAGGRLSKPDSPFGFIASMAASAINQGYKNMAIQSLYRLVANRKDNSLAVISDSWYTPTGRMVTMEDVNNGDARETDVGKEIWEPVYPNLDDITNIEEQKAVMDAFNADMEQRALLGTAVKGSAGLNLRDAFVFNNKKNEAQHIVKVKILGREQAIVFRGNPRVAQAINGELNPDARKASSFARLVRAVARFMAQMVTSFDPTFWAANFSRDSQTGLLNAYEKEGAEYAKKMMANIPFALGVIGAHIRGGEVKIKGAWSDAKKNRVKRLYSEYQKYAAGGAITGYSVIFNHAEYDRQFKRAVREKKKDLAALWAWIGDTFETLGKVAEGIEQVFRFATFITSREAGRPMEQCIDDAKNVTVNFNRKGSYAALEWEDTANITTFDSSTGTYSTLGQDGSLHATAERAMIWLLSQVLPYLRTSFMFVNPSIQGLYTLWSNAKVSPFRTASAVFGVAMTGFLRHLFAELLAPDPDDPEKNEKSKEKRELQYSHLPDYQRRSRIILPELGGVRVTIPLSQEYATFWAIGDIMATAAMKEKYDQETAWEIASAVGELLPVNPTEVANFVPDPIRPTFEAIINKDYRGRNLWWELTRYNKEQPDYTRVYDDTWTPLVDLSIALNTAMSGSSSIVPEGYGEGYLNPRWNNPAAWQHILEGVGGGPVKITGNVIELVNELTGPAKVKISNIPIVSRFVMDPYQYGNDWYLREEAKKFKTLAEKTGRRESALKKSEDEKDVQNLADFYKSDNYAIADLYNREYKKAIAALEKDIRERSQSKDPAELEYVNYLQMDLENLQRSLIEDVNKLLKERK